MSQEFLKFQFGAKGILLPPCPLFLSALICVPVLGDWSDVMESPLDSSGPSGVRMQLAEVVLDCFQEGAQNGSAGLSLKCSSGQSRTADPFACPTPKSRKWLRGFGQPTLRAVCHEVVDAVWWEQNLVAVQCVPAFTL